MVDRISLMKLLKMSDYISSIENCVKLINSVHGKSNYAPCGSFLNQSNTNPFRGDTRASHKDSRFSQYIGTRTCSQERVCSDTECTCGNRTNIFEGLDCTDIAELERLSANLIQLLSKAGHCYGKVCLFSLAFITFFYKHNIRND